jgi:circadian clock protein KaiC
MQEAVRRGEQSVVYSLEEAPQTLGVRLEAIGIPIGQMMESGRLSVVKIEPLLYCADEFALMVRDEVERQGTSIVMIDSICGYELVLRGQDLRSHLHALSKYLVNMGATTLLVNAAERITGEFRLTEKGISYIADNIVFLRYLEIDGRLRKAIGVLKKRIGDFEKSLRELDISKSRIKVGRPLTGLSGLLSGTPQWSKRAKGD